MPEPSLPLVVASNLPGLIVRFGWVFLRLQQVRKRGVRAFEDALRAGGLSSHHAAMLARKYHDAASIREIIGQVRRT